MARTTHTTGHTIAGDFQYGKFATSNEKAELQIFFTGTGEEHAVLLAPMLVVVKDDDFPDCDEPSSTSVVLKFDNTNPCQEGPGIDNMVQGGNAGCSGTKSGSSCPLSCAYNFIESASTVACVDGAWEEQTCFPDEESWSTGSVLIATVASALVAVPLAIYVVFKKGHIASHIFRSVALELGFLVGTVLFDAGDVVTDTLVAYTVCSDPAMREFHLGYIVCGVLGACTGIAVLLYRLVLICKLTASSKRVHAKQFMRRLSSAATGRGLSGEGGSLLAFDADKIRRDVESCYLSLLTVVVEDIPFVVLNLMVLSVHRLDMQQTQWSVHVGSTLVSVLMIGIKGYSLKLLPGLYAGLEKKQSEQEDQQA